MQHIPNPWATPVAKDREALPSSPIHSFMHCKEGAHLDPGVAFGCIHSQKHNWYISEEAFFGKYTTFHSRWLMDLNTTAQDVDRIVGSDMWRMDLEHGGPQGAYHVVNRWRVLWRGTWKWKNQFQGAMKLQWIGVMAFHIKDLEDSELQLKKTHVK